MRRLKFQKKLIVLTEKQWKGFVERYDIEEARRDGELYQLNFDCPICTKTEACRTFPPCRICTFFKFRTKNLSGCWVVLKKLIKQKLGKPLPRTLGMSPASIWWKIKDHEAVKEVFKVIQEALADMEKY